MLRGEGKGGQYTFKNRYSKKKKKSVGKGKGHA